MDPHSAPEVVQGPSPEQSQAGLEVVPEQPGLEVVPAAVPDPIRNAYPYESYSVSRHKLGLYHCVVVTARYNHAGQRDSSKAHPVYNALTTMIRRHGMLRVGIADTDVKKPFYSHVTRIDLRNHVELRTLNAASPEDYELKLAEQQGQRHNQRFENLTTIPPWRLTIFQREKGQETSSEGAGIEEDFMLAFHHSLMDGPSARMFHEQLVQALHYPSCTLRDREPDYILNFLAKPDLPPPREKVIPFNCTKTFIASTLWKALGPKFLQPASEPFWHGEAINFDLPRKTRVIPVDFPSEQLAYLLNACRSHGTTLTGLLHALILASLSRRTDPQLAPAFRSVTPVDCRVYFPPNTDPELKTKLGNYVSICNNKHRAIDVSAFRSSGSDLNSLIWSNAQRIVKSIAKDRASLPQNDPIMLLAWVSDMDKYFQEKDKQARDDSWEISNLGVIKGQPPAMEAAEGWKITRALFSNAAGVTGPAISVNVMSVPDGPLTCSVVWQEGVVPEELVAGLASDLKESAARVTTTGSFA